MAAAKADPAPAPAPTAGCHDCRFWLLRAHMGASVRQVGSCRRFPPVATMAGVSAQVLTGSTDWCAEHAA